MSDYQIVCVERLESHEHITHVGTGIPSRADERWTVAQVRSKITTGDVFFTRSPSTGHDAKVEPYDAVVNGTTIKTIRSTADAIFDNNLDNMRACHFTS